MIGSCKVETKDDRVLVFMHGQRLLQFGSILHVQHDQLLAVLASYKLAGYVYTRYTNHCILVQTSAWCCTLTVQV